MTVYTSRGIQGGAVYETQSTQKFSVMSELGLFNNFSALGTTQGEITDILDITQGTGLAIVPSGHTKWTY